jgi:glycosyltransferase involved in cell wall biosynthesis
MRRVVYVSHSREVGGAESYLAGLILQASHEHQVALICRCEPALDAWVKEIRDAGVTVHRLDFTRLRDFTRVMALARGADLAHLVLAYPVGKYQLAAALLIRLARRPLIITHQLTLDLGSLGLSAGRRRIWSAAFHAYALLATRHIAVSASGRELLVTKYAFPARLVEVIHNGVDATQHRPLPAGERVQLRRALGQVIAGESWSDETNIIATVARLSLQKGLGDLVQAAAAVGPRRPQARFLIIGDGDQRATLAAQIAAAGLTRQVFLAGALPQETVAGWLAASDLFVLPSHFEGLPLSLLEAMAAGCPAIATSVGGNTEVINSEAVGALVAPRQPAELAAAIMRLLDDPDGRVRIGAAARARVARDFDREAGYDRTLALYDELVAPRG